jgi:hypothetical protein
MVTKYDVCVDLVRKDDLKGLQYLNSTFNLVESYNVVILDTTIECGHLDILMWLLDAKIYKDRNHIVLDLVLSKSPFQRHMADWLKERGHYNKNNSSFYYVPAIRNNRDGIRWLMDNDCVKDELVIEVVAEKGLLETMKYLWDNNFPIRPDLYIVVVSFVYLGCIEDQYEKNIEMLEWLYALYPKIPLNMINVVLEKNILPILKWFVAKGLKIDVSECRRIAKKGQCTEMYDYLMTL